MKSLHTLGTRLEPAAWALLRVVAGAMFAVHGAQKILGWYASRPPPAFGTQLWLGGLIELVAGVLIAVGLLTRPAAFLSSGTMAVAYVQFHWKGAFEGGQWLPAVNRGELALLYCLLFLFLTLHGAGAFSLDALLRSRGRAISSPPEVDPGPAPAVDGGR